MSKKYKKIIVALLIGFLVSGFVSALKLGKVLDVIDQKLSHFLYSEREIKDDIVIIAIDDATLTSVNDGGLGQIGKWPYKYYAKVLNNINAGQPAVVMIDILFAETERYLSLENFLADLDNKISANEFTQKVLSYVEMPNPDEKEFIEALTSIKNIFLAKTAYGKGNLEGDSFIFDKLVLPLEIFTDVSQTGFINSNTRDNRTIYDAPYQFTVDGVTEPNIDIKIAEAYLNKKLEKPPLKNGLWLINFAKKSNSFPIYSFVDVYKGLIDPLIFKDKIVLIGPTATILQDLFYTPIDEEQAMSGIEIRANAIQTLLDQAFLEYQGIGDFILLITIITLASVFAFLYLPVWGASIVFAAELFLFPVYAQWRFDRGVVINLILPIFAIILSYLLAMIYRNVTEFREKRHLKRAFAHYVSPDLVEKIMASGEDLALGGERRFMTTLFLDIENFTSLSEKLQAHEVVAVINLYFDAFAKEIMAHGGTVDKFEGDAIMALFGAPIKFEDHAIKACETALAIRSRIVELNKKSGHDLNVRIGIASGECIIGNMGSEHRFDYTAMGDTVNTASRLEGANKFYGTNILLNAKSMKEAQSELFFRRIDRVRLKGKEEAVDIYELLGAKNGVSEEGKALINKWHSALEYYRNGDWDTAEEKIRSILEIMPDDGPSLAYLKRIQNFRSSPPSSWDGIHTFMSK